MNSSFKSAWPSWALGGCLLITSLLSVPVAHAGLTFTVDLYVSGGNYTFYTPMNTNALGAPAPFGIYTVSSPGQPGNGSWRQFNYDANGFSTIGGSETNFSDLASAIQHITNETWTLTLTNATATNSYSFKVSLPGGLTTNQLPATLITSPANSANDLTNRPTFTWTGQPTNWPVSGSVYVNQYGNNSSFFCPATLPNAQTDWTIPVAIPASNPGSYTYFNLNYVTNYASDLFVATTPTNISQSIDGWAYNSTLESGGQVNFTVAAPPSAGAGHTLVAHYAFDNSSNLGEDSSPNGNNLECGSLWGSNISEVSTVDAEAGGGAVQFFGDSSITPCNDPTFDHWTNALLGSFTVSAWIKTANVVGNDDDQLNDGSGQTVIYLNNNGNGVIPLGLTGTKAAIATGVAPGASGQDTLNSSTSVTSGSYVHVVATRDEGSGLKQIYINGAFDASHYAEPGILDGGADYASIGGELGAPFTGKLDDVQIYSGVLSSAEINYLYNHPGSLATDVSLNGLVAHYDFDEGAALAADVSGNGNNLVFAGAFSGSGPDTDTNHIGTSGGSVYFDGGSFLSAPTNLLSTLAGDFTISFWVKTTQDNGNPDYPAWAGDAIFSADIPNPANDLLPAALTGGQVAFNTPNNDDSQDDTINSSAYVSDGEWHHVVVSRNQPTGDKFIYIDGVLDVSGTSSTNLLNDPQLLTIGCKADASDSDPSSPTSTGSNGYNGWLDDIQIYNRVVSPTEVAFLHDNPGATLGSFTAPQYPVDVDLHFGISREESDYFGKYYSASVSFNSVSPEASTTNSVRSPNNYFHSETYPGGGTGGSAILNSLDDVINEFTNGVWKIYINEGSPTQQVYSFNVSITGLDTNLLRAVTVFWPTNGAVNVATNPVFQWSGPTNFSTLVVDLLSGPAIFPPVSTTNWPSPPTLNYGPDRFDVGYTSNNFPGVTFTAPLEDSSSAPLNSWNTTVDISTISFNNFTVGEPAPLPVQLLNLQPTNGTFRFSFQTLAGRPHTIQSRTNLTIGTWTDLSNFTGDGSLKQFAFPATNPPTRFFRVNTQ